MDAATRASVGSGPSDSQGHSQYDMRLKIMVQNT